jgi:hypothetical protein
MGIANTQLPNSFKSTRLLVTLPQTASRFYALPIFEYPITGRFLASISEYSKLETNTLYLIIINSASEKLNLYALNLSGTPNDNNTSGLNMPPSPIFTLLSRPVAD